MSFLDPSVAQSGGGLTPLQQANIVFGTPATDPSLKSAVSDSDAAAVELNRANTAAAAVQTSLSEPADLAAAAALTARVVTFGEGLASLVQAHSVSEGAAVQLLSADVGMLTANS